MSDEPLLSRLRDVRATLDGIYGDLHTGSREETAVAFVLDDAIDVVDRAIRLLETRS